MSTRTIVWTLAILAIVLVVIPLLLCTLGMTACSSGMSMAGMMSGTMTAVSVIGAATMLRAAVVVVALAVFAVRGVNRV